MTDPCLSCGGRTFARVDQMIADGTFAPGPWVRCVGCKRAVLDPVARPTSPATLQVPDPDVRERRHNAVATAFALLDSFAGDGLAHVYGNGQTLDASDVCVELAAAFGMEAEPGWERRVAAILAALPLDGREVEDKRLIEAKRRLSLTEGCLDCNADDERFWHGLIRFLEEVR